MNDKNVIYYDEMYKLNNKPLELSEKKPKRKNKKAKSIAKKMKLMR